MSELNVKIKEAIDSFDTDQARELLRDAIKEADAETYFLASKVALDDDQKQEFLQRAVELDPFHEKAQKAIKQSRNALSESVNSPIDYSPDSQTNNSDATYVTGMVMKNTRIFTIPIREARIRTELEANTVVHLISRYDYHPNTSTEIRWYQILHQSPVTNVIGWIEAENMRDMTVNDMQIQILDLPEVDWSSDPLSKRQDFKALLESKKSSNHGLLGFLILLLLVFTVLSYFPVNLLLDGADSVTLVSLIIGGILAIIVSIGYKPIRDKFAEMGPLQMEINELNRIQKLLRSEYETMLDDQRTNMAINAALNLGVNVATRMVSNKQDVRIRK